ncbi:MAG: hypothetical protein HQL70_05090 [Magnetococcales bacterium]|nr:hypothetical protein [Magnetococcales bacterium]
MHASINYQSTAANKNIPLPLALNGILTPEEYNEQTQFGLLRGIFSEESVKSDSTIDEKELYYPFFQN